MDEYTFLDWLKDDWKRFTSDFAGKAWIGMAIFAVIAAIITFVTL